MTNIIISGPSIKELKTVYNRFLLLDPSMKVVRLPIKYKKFTTIRSPHVTNRSREQFEALTFKWVLLTKIPSDIIKRYLQTSGIRDSNPGVLMNCKKSKNKKNYTPIKVFRYDPIK